MIEMMYLKEITKDTSELDVFDDSSNLFTLKNWTSKAVPLDQAFLVLGDMFEDEESVSNRKFDA